MLLQRAVRAIVAISLLSFLILHVYRHSDPPPISGKILLSTTTTPPPPAKTHNIAQHVRVAAQPDVHDASYAAIDVSDTMNDKKNEKTTPLPKVIPASKQQQNLEKGHLPLSAVNRPPLPPQRSKSQVSSGPVEVKATLPRAHTVSVQAFLNDRTYVDKGYEDKYYHSHREEETIEEAVINYNLNRSRVMCSSDIVEALDAPMLSEVDMKWCKWAISPSGGQAVVGKTWGKITSNKDKARFEFLNCNYVSLTNGGNPSCNDQWGDSHVKRWLANPVRGASVGSEDRNLCNEENGFKSRFNCYDNTNNDRFCTAEKVVIDFGRMKSIGNNKRNFPGDFFSLDCNSKDDKRNDNIFQFKNMMTLSLDRSAHCDYYINGTVLIFSHDHVLNLGHTQQDYMNVFLMLWMDAKGLYSKDIPLLTIDGMRLYNSRDDLINSFYEHYSRTFKSIYRANDFNGKKVCIDRIITQPIPPKLFVWDRWTDDIPCTFIGPSSLFQRFNLNIRHRYNMLARRRGTAKRLKIVLIVRKASQSDNAWGTLSTSRNFLNYDEALRRLKAHADSGGFDFEAVNLGAISFQHQFELISKSSIIVGMHGAGISALVNMPLGDDNCCGLIEMFPQGELLPARGHGNMARRMGVKYTRIEISADASRGDGAVVPVDRLLAALIAMEQQVQEKPTCLLPGVISDPAFRLGRLH